MIRHRLLRQAQQVCALPPPRTAVLNNLEFDHADIFDDLAAIERQFHHLVRTVPPFRARGGQRAGREPDPRAEHRLLEPGEQLWRSGERLQRRG